MPHDALPDIPVIDAAPSEDPALTAVRQEPDKANLLLDTARMTYTPAGVWLAEGISRRWVRKANPPYANAVAAIDRHVRRPGAYLLNHSYEWGCTTGAVDDASQGGVSLLRTLDWPLAGLGRGLVVTRWAGSAGPILSVTWPGYVGVLTGLAPGRFAAAINQPPLPPSGWGKPLDWVLARVRTARSTAIPPVQLLRQTFETCRDFAEAVAMIRDTPICIPAIFTIAGTRPGQALVIERTASSAFIPARPAAANHWASTAGPKGRPRNASSEARRASMLTLIDAAPAWSLDWLRPPILLSDTRVAVMANAATGHLLVRGFEADGPATSALSLP